MKLSASGVEPTFSQGKVTYLTTGLLRQLNNSTIIKVLLKWYRRHEIFAILKEITNKQIYSDIYSMIK
ncbi:hypothetical protein PFTANZ_04054 [Plasmodium falciparum Tanzania (2000708)]|uniref:Uncharacterized protein n=1 Tax=Plasmodium falciparum Tanzania (2000708) TaxID=1036725 RepID=A0A024W3H1_PLAFA|nr:hypothetical protein PFTANZ_04054 [Plasmodium falciparum Tanzania (2000708)]